MPWLSVIVLCVDPDIEVIKALHNTLPKAIGEVRRPASGGWHKKTGLSAQKAYRVANALHREGLVIKEFKKRAARVTPVGDKPRHKIQVVYALTPEGEAVYEQIKHL